MRGPARRIVRHGTVAVDQAVSSASNFLLALLVAQSATAAEFGHFAIATSVYWLALGGMRAFVAEPLLIIQGSDGRDLPQARAAAGLAVGLSLAGAVVGLGLLVLLGPHPVAVLLVCLPVLLWQDIVRYGAFTQGRPGEALLSDGIWLVLLAGIGVAVLVGGAEVPASPWLLMWAAAALPAALLSSVRTAVWPARAGIRAWLLRSRSQAAPMLGDFAVLNGSGQVLIFLLPLVASFSLLGQAKAAQVVTGPLSVLMTAASVVALPLLAREWTRRGVVPVRTGLLAGAAIGAVAACYGVGLLLLPESWGRGLFGDSWIGVGVLPALFAFQYAIVFFSQGAVLVLRAIGRPGRLLVVRIALVPLGLVVPLLAVHYGGLLGLGLAAIGLACVYGVAWWSLVLFTARRERRVVAEPVPA